MPLVNLGDLVDRAKDPAQLAVIDCLDWAAPREFTHDEIDRLAQAVARGLLRHGLSRGDSVAILSANRAEFLVAYLGIMRAGLVAVPVNHRFPRETIDFILRDCDAKLVFCDPESRPPRPADVPTIEFGTAFEAFLDRGEFESVRPSPDETAMVLYTSGSTGRPKGVLLSHTGHLWAVQQRLRGGPHSHHRLLIAAPLFHMNGLASAKFALAAHAGIVLLPRFDAIRYVEAIGRFGCTWLTSVPTMIAMAMRERDALARTDLSTVRLVRMGSAPATQALIDAVRRTFPGAVVSNGYGTTEAGPVVFGPRADGTAKPDLALGWPQPDVEIRVIDGLGRDAVEGVLLQRSPGVMKGYLNLPEETKKVLTEDGWFVSGDVVRRDAAGAYWFVGRSDDMFVCGGENVYPGEVEHMLEKHPAVVQACVVPIPDEIKGAKPFAFVVLGPGVQLTEDAVKQYALAHAPAYQHPRHVIFLANLPLAGTNKIDRQALKASALEHLRQRGRAEP